MSAGGAPIVIVGGGLAGISAAIVLAQAGRPVALLETRKKLGGRATSFVDVRSGETLDNCQHVVLGCCTNYLDLLKRLGALDRLTWTRSQYWLEPGGRCSIVRPGTILPAPSHFTTSVLLAKFLTLGEKTRLALGMLKVMRADRRMWLGKPFSAFLSHAKQPARLVDRFWSPVVISACNLSVERCCAASALHVFQEGFLATSHAADIGLSRVPLVELYDRAEAIITGAGGDVRLGASVDSIMPDRVRLAGGGELAASRVIAALPPERASQMISPATDAHRRVLDAMGHLTHSPILGVHLRFDRPVMTTPHAVLVGASTQWLFRKNDEGTAVHAVISAADEWMPLDEAEITRRVVADLHAHIPSSRGATLMSSRPVKEKRATFALTPNAHTLRPAADSLLVADGSGIILAGDATDTGWPATMEGAVRSGYAAAALAMRAPVASLLKPDDKPGLFARLMGLRGSQSPLLNLDDANRRLGAAADKLSTRSDAATVAPANA